MLRIGLNLHLLTRAAGYRAAGVHGYSWRVVSALARYDDRHQYMLFHALDDLAVFPQFRFPAEHQSVTWTAAHPLLRIAWEQMRLPDAARQCDLLHCPVNILPWGVRQPAIVTIHDLAFLQHPAVVSAERRRYLRHALAASVRRARLIIAISQQTRADLLACWDIPQDRVRVVYPAIDPLFRPVEPAVLAAWRAELGLVRPFALWLGTIEPRKNLTMLVEAYAAARSQGLSDLDLVLAGALDWQGGTVADALRARIAALGLTQWVHLPGFVADAARPLWYAAAQALVMPSLAEGFGLPAAEALACGTPVLASESGSLREIVGLAGIFTPADDRHAWSDRLLRLSRDRVWREDMAGAARCRAELFSEERLAQALMALYDEAAASWNGSDQPTMHHRPMPVR